MAVNKVVVNGETILDLTGDTVTAATLAQGVKAHDKAGNAIVGTMQSGGAPTPITAGDTPIFYTQGIGESYSTSYLETPHSYTVKKAGTYRFKFWVTRERTSGCGSQLRRNGTSVYQNTDFSQVGSGYYQENVVDLACNAGDTLTVWLKGQSQYYGCLCYAMAVCINWDTGF